MNVNEKNWQIFHWYASPAKLILHVSIYSVNVNSNVHPIHHLMNESTECFLNDGRSRGLHGVRQNRNKTTCVLLLSLSCLSIFYLFSQFAFRIRIARLSSGMKFCVWQENCKYEFREYIYNEQIPRKMIMKPISLSESKIKLHSKHRIRPETPIVLPLDAFFYSNITWRASFALAMVLHIAS